MKFELQKLNPVHLIYADEFDKGPHYTNLRPQGNGDWLLTYTLGGAGVVGTDLAEIPVGSGDVTLYDIGAPQAYYTAQKPGRWHFLWVHFAMKPAWKELSDWPSVIKGVRRVKLQDDGLCLLSIAALREVVEWVRNPAPMAPELAMNAFERFLLLVTLDRKRDQLTALDSRIKRAQDALNRDYSQPFDLTKLAAEAGLSVSRLAHLFHEQLGQTPQRYAEERRLSHAQHLLRITPMPVKEIAGVCGYANAFYFSNRFRRIYGMSPQQYREKNQKCDGSWRNSGWG